MANGDAGKLEEIIEPFTFRNKGSIVIPKSRREKAYIMAVDVFIDSIAYPSYKSAKTEPDESFYGYATLVFQDALSDKIALRFGRNRIYYARNNEALAQWEFHRQYYKIQDNILFLYRAIAGNDAPSPVIFPPVVRFVELPLREVYVECQVPTQFQIEYTQWQPIPYTNDAGNQEEGDSKQDDGDKDSGLPSGGTQPRQNPPDNPFQGNNPPSNASQLGEFFNPKFGTDGSLSNLNDAGDSGKAPEGAKTEQLRMSYVTTCTPNSVPVTVNVFSEKFAFTGQGLEWRRAGGTCGGSLGWLLYSNALGRGLTWFFDKEETAPWNSGALHYVSGGSPPSPSYL